MAHGMDDEAGRSDALLRLLFSHGALHAGEFVLRSGRTARYFVDFGTVHSAASASALGANYAAAIHHRILVDMVLSDTALRDGRLPFVLFGPAYKGIPLAVATAMVLLTQYGCDADWAFNRKQPKTHGEGGALVGAPLADRRVLLLDDVFSDGSAARDSLVLVREQGGEPSGLLVGFDRQEEKASGSGEAADAESTTSAAWQRETGLPMWSLSNREALLAWLRADAERAEESAALLAAVSVPSEPR